MLLSIRRVKYLPIKQHYFVNSQQNHFKLKLNLSTGKRLIYEKNK